MLDEEWLAQRRADLSEYGYAVNRRAEQLRDDERPKHAVKLLEDTRRWLRQGERADWMRYPTVMLQ